MGSAITTDFKPIGGPIEIGQGSQSDISFGVPLENMKKGLVTKNFIPTGRPISTVTGKPVPTSEEYANQAEGVYKKTLKTALPIMGDIAMTAVAPELKIAQGAKWGTKLGIKGINALLRASASASGSAGGSATADLVTGDDVNAQDAKTEALLGGGGELVTSAGGGLLKLAGKTAKNTVNLLSDFTKVGQGAKGQAFKSLKKARNKIVDDTTQNAIDFMGKVGTSKSKTETGMKIGEVLKGKTDWDKVYSDPNEMIKYLSKNSSDGLIQLDNASQMFGDLIRKYDSEFQGLANATGRNRGEAKAVDAAINWMGFKVGSKEARLFKEFAYDESITPRNANFLVKKIWKSHSTDPHQVVSWKEAFKDNIIQDIQKGAGNKIDFEAALKASDKIFGDTNNWFRNNPTADAIISKMGFGRSETRYFQEYPERVINRLYKASPEQLKNIKQAVIKEPGGDAAWAGLEFNYVKDMYAQSMKQAKGTGKRELLPDDLALRIWDSEDTIKAINPDLWPGLKKQADLYSEMAKRFEPVDTTTGMDLFSAWGVLKPKQKALLSKTGKVVGGITKRATKAGIHMAGQGIKLRNKH